MGSFKSAFRGFPHAATQRNFRVLVVCSVIAYALLAFFEVPAADRMLIVALAIITIVAEIFNTAIEELSDALVQEHHPGIAKVKELAAAAVFLLSVTTLVMTIYVLWSYL